MNKDVVFVVIGRNEGQRLAQSFGALTRLSDQIVYADSGSSDGSVELARSMGVTAVSLDASRPMNAARGRNAGFAEARRCFPEARYVQFLDGDCVIVPGWVPQAQDFLESHPRAAIACGRRFERAPEESFYNRLADDEWNTPVGKADACGGDSMMRVAAFEEVGGFDDALMAGEEPELCARLRAKGWEIWRLDGRMTEHDAATHHLSQWWRRSLRSGFGSAQAWQRTRHLPHRLYSATLRRALFWAALLPLVVVLLALFFRRAELLLLLPAIYGAQIARMTFRHRGDVWYTLRVSAILMLGKWPELIGAARYFLGGGRVHSIEYKSTRPASGA